LILTTAADESIHKASIYYQAYDLTKLFRGTFSSLLYFSVRFSVDRLCYDTAEIDFRRQRNGKERPGQTHVAELQ
jgi:hypothetical protein